MVLPKQAKKKLLPLRRFSFLLVVLATLVGSVYTYTRVTTPIPVQAATSSTINFQARLSSSSGQVVPDGYYNVQFNLYNVSSGGSTLWTETRDYNGGAPDNRVRVVNGYLTVNLGSVTAFPGTINWDQEHWLGLTIRGDGTCMFAACTPADSEMTPRLKLTAVPYALKAGLAANVRSNDTNAASTHSDAITLQSGNALGATSNSGNILIDSGTATQTAGTISVGTANTSGITIGRATVTTILQGNLRFGALNCTSNTNGGALTADGSGNISCSDDDGGGGGTLQAAYDAGNTITTTDARNLSVTLANTATDANFIINIATSSNGELKVQNNGTDVLQIGAAGQLQLDVQGSTGGLLIGGDAALYRSAADTLRTGNLFVQPASNGDAFRVNNTGGSDILRVDTNTAEVITKRLYATGTDNVNAMLEVNQAGTAPIFQARDNSVIVASIADGGAALFQNSTNSTTAFQIQNAAGVTSLNVNTSTIPNLVANPTFESNTNGWLAKGTATLSNSTEQALYGSQSLKIVTGTASGNGATYRYTFIPSTPYSFSFWARKDAGSAGSFDFGRIENASQVETSCPTGQTLTTTWTQFTCTFTTGGTMGTTDGIYIEQTDTASDNIYLEGITLVQSSTVQVYNAGGSQLQVEPYTSNLVLNGLNSGELQPWRTNANVLPVGAEEHASVVANGYAYVIGGQGVSTVYYAKLNSDGSTGSWTTNSNPLPGANESLMATAANGYIYAIGGNDGSCCSSLSSVYYAKLNPDGSTGAWQTNSVTLPEGRHESSVVTANGYIYIIGGLNGLTGRSTTYYGKVNADGSISSWSTQNGGSLGSGQSHSGVVANGYIYVVARVSGASEQDNVVYAKINADGTLGASGAGFSSTTVLPTNRGDLSAVAANGYLYAIAGEDGGSTNNSTVYIARLNADGTIGSWVTSVYPLPFTRSQHTSIVNNGYIYVIGGQRTPFTSAEATVYYSSLSRSRIAGSLDLVGISQAGSGGQTFIDEGGQGGSLTAGNTSILGWLNVSGPATINQSLVVGDSLNVGGYGLFKNAVNSTTSFQIQNALGVSHLTADTVNNKLTVGNGGLYVPGLGVPAVPVITAGSNQGGTLSGSSANTYIYKITALNAAGETLASSETSFVGSSFTPLTAPTAPTAAIGAAGNVTGTYTYRVTFITANGETTQGTASGSVSPAAQQVNLTAIPTGPTGTTGRNVYRCDGAGANCLRMSGGTTLSNNTTTILTDNTASYTGNPAPPGANTATTNLNNATVTFTPITGATSYRIYRKSSGQSFFTNNAYQTTTASPFTDTGAAGTSSESPTTNTIARIAVGTTTPTANLEAVGDVLFKGNDGSTLFSVNGSTLEVRQATTALTGNLQTGTLGTTIATSDTRTELSLNYSITDPNHDITIGPNGFPIIAYYAGSGNDLRFIKCGNSACSSGNIDTLVDATGSVGEFPSIGVSNDGMPVIAYHDVTNTALKVVKCGNAACSSGNTITTVDNAAAVGTYTDLAIGADGIPIITYRDTSATDLKIAKCSNAACTASTITSLTDANITGYFTNIAIGTDGLPIITHFDDTADAVKVVKCSNAACTASTITSFAGANSTRFPAPITMGADGLPIFAFYDSSNDSRFVKCTTASCSSSSMSGSIIFGNIIRGLALGQDGLPLLATQTGGGNARITKCGNAGCTSGNVTTTIDSTGTTGYESKVVVGTDGLPIALYGMSSGTQRLVITKCGNANCTGAGTTRTGGVDIGSIGSSFQNAYVQSIRTSDAASPLTVMTNNVERLRIDGSGNATFATNNNLFKNSTDSSLGFQIQNATSEQLLVAGTNSNNLIDNSSFEQDINGWTTGSFSTITQTGAQSLFGSKSLSVDIGSAANRGGIYVTGVNRPSSLAPSSTYTISWYDKLNSGTFTDVIAAYSVDGTAGAGEVACTGINTQVVLTTGWTRHTCTISTTAATPTTTAYIIIKQVASATRIFFIDGVQLELAAAATPYTIGTLTAGANLTATGTSLFKNTGDGTTAFQIQRSNADLLFTADTSNNRLIVGNATATTGADSTLLVVDSATTANLPTAVNGGIIYDSTTGKFKVVENVAGTPTYKTLCNTTDLGCGSAGVAFVQGGNAFGATGVLGTTDANGLQIITGASSTGRAYFDTGNNLYLGNAGTTGTAAVPDDFNLRATGSSTAGTAGAMLNIFGGAGTATGTGSAGGTLSLQGGNAGNGSTARAGGLVTINGGTASGTGTALGGAVTIQAGTSVGTTTGSSVTITGGTGVGTNQNGGNVTIKGGANTGSGVSGSVIIAPNASDTPAVFQVQNSISTPLLTVDSVNNDLKVATNIIATGSSAGSSTVTSGTGTNTTTVNLAGGVGGWVNDDVVYIDNAGQDYYTRIVAGGGTATLTVSPAVTYEAARTVAKYNVQNIGSATNGIPLTNNERFFQGYFLGGIVAGTGSTSLSDGNLQSSNALTITASGTSNTGITAKTTTNSTTAFQIQNAAGTSNLFVADTTNTKLGVGMAPTAGGATLQVTGDITATSNISGSSILSTNNFTAISTALNTGNFRKCVTIGTGGVSTNDVVVLANDGGVTKIIRTTTARDTRVYGVVMNTSCGTEASVAFTGMAEVTADTGAVAIGDQLVTSTTSGQVTVNNNATTGILGVALTAKSGGASGLVSVNINTVNGQYSPTFRNASDSTTAFQIQNANASSTLFAADTQNNDLKVAANIIAQGAATANTGTTSGTGTNTTTLTLTGSVAAFANDDVLFIDNAGQDYFTRIVSGAGTATLTVSPAITFETGRTVTEYSIQNIGSATNTTPATNTERFFQGYFLGGIVAGAGSTHYADGSILFQGDTNLYRSAANTLKTDDNLQAPSITLDNGGFISSSGYLQLISGAANDQILFKSNGGTTENARFDPSGNFILGPSGSVGWSASSGTGVADTSLYRAGAGNLGTGSILSIGSQVVIYPSGNNGILEVTSGGNVLRNYLAGGDAQYAFGITSLGQIGWGVGGSTAPDTNLYRNAGSSLATDDAFYAALNIQAGADITARLAGAGQVQIGAVGAGSAAGLTFGSAADTNFYRSAADNLKTDDNFNVSSLATPGTPSVNCIDDGGSIAPYSYSYTVVAVDAAGNTTPASPAAVGSCTFPLNGTGEVSVYWTKVPGAVSYRVYKANARYETTYEYAVDATYQYFGDADYSAGTAGSAPTTNTTHYNRLSSNSTSWIGGRLAVGGATGSYALDVTTYGGSTYVARIKNLDNQSNADGLLIDVGSCNACRGTGNYFVGFASGGTIAGKIQGGANAVAYTTTGADYAEYFLTGDVGNKPQTGDIVMLDATQNRAVIKSNAAKSLVGVVSDNPGFIGNGPLCQEDDEDCDANYAQTNTLVGISGQLKTKVSTLNGPIQTGDDITASSISGTGAKLAGRGEIIGKALESFDPANGVGTTQPCPAGSPAGVVCGTVMVYVNPHYSDDQQSVQGQDANFADILITGNAKIDGDVTVANTTTTKNLIVTDNATAGSLTVSDVITAKDLVVTGNASVQGKLTVASIDVGTIKVNGHIVTAGDAPAGEVLGAIGLGATVTIDGNDTAGTLTITTGSSEIAAGDLAKITFNKQFGKIPKIVLSPQNEPTSAAKIFPSSKTISDYILKTSQTLPPNTTYIFDYFIVE